MGFSGEGGALAFLVCCDATIQMPRGALKIRPRLGLLEQPIRDLVSTKQFPINERVEVTVVSMRGSFSYSLIQFFGNKGWDLASIQLERVNEARSKPGWSE